jgi:Tfp pilus assembly protein PilF
VGVNLLSGFVLTGRASGARGVDVLGTRFAVMLMGFGGRAAAPRVASTKGDSNVKRWIIGLVAIALAGAAGVAQARNFHISGGVQYVSQGLVEKNKGNLEDAHRIFGKAVTQLSVGVAEDPKDNEAWEYLARAYAEYGNADSAGWAFEEASKRAAADPKLKTRVDQNRLAYWTVAFNDGIRGLQDADKIVTLDKIATSTDPKAAEAKAKVAEAEASLKKAQAYWPSKAKTYPNLAVAQALQGKTAEASATLDRGLAAVPESDPDRKEIVERKEQVAGSVVSEKLNNKDYDAALAMLDAQLAKTPNDFTALNQAAEASYSKAQGLEAAKDTAGAGVAYAKAAGYFQRAAAVATDAKDKGSLFFNYTLATLNSNDKAQIKDMTKATFDQLQTDKQNGQLHMMLARGYQVIGMDDKASEHALVGRALGSDAEKLPDVKAYVDALPKTSDGGKLVAEKGAPDEVRRITTGNQKLDVWFYWPANRAYAMLDGRKISAATLDEYGAPAAPAATAKKK